MVTALSQGTMKINVVKITKIVKHLAHRGT